MLEYFTKLYTVICQAIIFSDNLQTMETSGDRQNSGTSGAHTMLAVSGGQRVLQIENPSNSCYAIGVVNLLLSSPPVVNFIQNCELKDDEGGVVQELHTIMAHEPGKTHGICGPTL